MSEKLVEDENDLFLEIYANSHFFKGVLETSPTLKTNKKDRKYIIELYKRTTNNIINNALPTQKRFNLFDGRNINNNKLPENYIKPSNVKLLQMINQLDKKQIEATTKFIKNLLKNNEH